MKEEKLDRLLDFLEDNIDLENSKKTEEITFASIKYNKVPYLPLSVLFIEQEAYIPYDYSEAYENPEKMLFNELVCGMGSAYKSVKLKDDSPIQIRSNHGIGIIPSLFGAKSRLISNSMPWVDHLNGMSDIKKVILKEIPDFGSSLAGRVIDTLKYYNDRLKEYPKCFKAIHITQPDMQGPFDIAHLLLGSDIFYEVYDNPDILHELLELITRTYIDYRRYIDKFLTDNAGSDAVYVHGSIFGGKVLIKDDTAAINLSEEMYKEFSGKYNEKILLAFDGGGSIHSCGRLHCWYLEAVSGNKLKGINYGNPELQDLNTIYESCSKKKIPIIWWGYNQNHEFLQYVYARGINTGMTIACKTESLEKAQEIVKIHRYRCEEMSIQEREYEYKTSRF